MALEHENDALRLSVSDDGTGLPGPVDIEALKAAGHYGLAGMQERARAIGAELSIESGPDGGTTVAVRFAGPSEPNLELVPTDSETPRARILGSGRIRRRSARVRA